PLSRGSQEDADRGRVLRVRAEPGERIWERLGRGRRDVKEAVIRLWVDLDRVVLAGGLQAFQDRQARGERDLLVPAAEQPECRYVHAPQIGDDVEAGGVPERLRDLGLGREGLVASVTARQL